MAGSRRISGFGNNRRHARRILLQYREPMGHVPLPHVAATVINMSVAIGNVGSEVAKLLLAGGNTGDSVR